MTSQAYPLAAGGRIAPPGIETSAIANYGIEVTAIEFLQESENAVFRVNAKSGSYVLRIHRPASMHNSATPALSRQAIISELTWMEFLCKAGIAVPSPVHTRDGSLVTETVVPQTGESRYCTLLHRVAGNTAKASITPELMAPIGALMARMHVAAQQFTPPAGFARPCWELQSLQEAVSACGQLVDHALLRREGLYLVQACAAEAEQRMLTLGHAPEQFGMIHADLNPDNCVFEQGIPHAIDFCSCGFGHFLFDIAQAISAAPSVDYCVAFIKGYQAVRDLPLGFGRALDVFLAVSNVYWLSFQLNRHNLEFFRKYLPNKLAQLERVMLRKPFFAA